MAKYKVLVDFELEPAVEAAEGVEAKDAVLAKVGDTVELSEERAAEVGSESLEPVTDEAKG